MARNDPPREPILRPYQERDLTVILGPGVAELIAQGYLSRFVTYAPAQRLDLTGVRTRAGDFALDDLARAMSGSVIITVAVEEYTRLCAGAPAIAFCVDVAHSQMVAAAFAARGYRAAHVSSLPRRLSMMRKPHDETFVRSRHHQSRRRDRARFGSQVLRSASAAQLSHPPGLGIRGREFLARMRLSSASPRGTLLVDVGASVWSGRSRPTAVHSIARAVAPWHARSNGPIALGRALPAQA
jgi:hypothetical protein